MNEEEEEGEINTIQQYIHDQQFLEEEEEEEERQEIETTVVSQPQSSLSPKKEQLKPNSKPNSKPASKPTSKKSHKRGHVPKKIITEFKTLSLSENELRAIFEAKCKDFKVKFQENLFQRFVRRQSEHHSQKVLHMEGCGLGPLAASLIVEAIFIHSNLVVIDFSDNFLGDEGALCFADLIINTQHIISIDLSSNHMTDKGIKTIFQALSANKSMISINIGSKTSIGRNSVGDESIKEISKMLSVNKVVSELNLSMTELNSINVSNLCPGLSVNTTLTYLNVSNNNIKSKGAIAILKSITKSSNIIELSMSDNSLKDDIAPFITSFLSSSKTITKVDLSGNQLTHNFTTCLASNHSNSIALAITCTVEELILSRNPLGRRGISMLGGFVAHNQRLKKLVVNGCLIDVTGFVEFCEDLKRNTSLEVIEITHNPLTDDGIQKLSLTIAKHPTLKVLDLEMTEFSDQGCQYLFDSLRSNEVLKLSLKNNLIHNGMIIQKSLQENPKILYLDTEFNDIDYKSSLEIKRLIHRNLKMYRQQQTFRLSGKIQKCDTESPNVERQLRNTRTAILEERNTISKLEKEKNELENFLVLASDHRNQVVSELERKNSMLEDEVMKLMDDCRNKSQEARNGNQRIEMSIGQMSSRLAREIETFRTECKTEQSLQGKIHSIKGEFAATDNSILDRYKEAKNKYIDAMNLLIAAFNQVKEEKEMKELHEKLEQEKLLKLQSSRKTGRQTVRGKKKPSSADKTENTDGQNDNENEPIENKNDDNKNEEETSKSGKRSKLGSRKKKRKNSPPSKSSTKNNSAMLSTTETPAQSAKVSKNDIKMSSRDKDGIEKSVLVQKSDKTFETQPNNTKMIQAGDGS